MLQKRHIQIAATITRLAKQYGVADQSKPANEWELISQAEAVRQAIVAPGRNLPRQMASQTLNKIIAKVAEETDPDDLYTQSLQAQQEPGSNPAQKTLPGV